MQTVCGNALEQITNFGNRIQSALNGNFYTSAYFEKNNMLVKFGTDSTHFLKKLKCI